jgi:Uma2 family endonuclease
MIQTVKSRATLSDYLALPESNQIVELLDGEIIMSATPVPKHQRLVGRFYMLINTLKPNGEVFVAPLGVYLDDDNVPEPDVLWLAENSRCKVGEKLLEGVPDLIVEVLSPGTARQDKVKKFRLYERFGVPEYWIADPIEEYIEVYTLVSGSYQRIGAFVSGESFFSPGLNKQVNLGAIFA